MKRMFFVLVVLASFPQARPRGAAIGPSLLSASSDPNAVLYWSQVAESTISVGRPPASSEVLNGLVHAAIYDAVVSVKGEYEPFAVSIRRSGPTSVDAAVAAAARGVLVIRVPGQASVVEAAYATFIGGIPDGSRKTNGIRLGEAVAGAYLALRSDDGFDNVVPWVQPHARPRRVRADPVQQHPGRHQAQAGSAALIRRPGAVSAGRAERADEPRLHGGLQRGQAPRPGRQRRADARADGDRTLLDGAGDGLLQPQPPQPRGRARARHASRRHACSRWCTSPPRTHSSGAGRRSSTTSSGGRRPRSSGPTPTVTPTRSRTRPGRICSWATIRSTRPATPASRRR